MCYYNSQANLSKRQKNNRIWFNTKLTKFIFVFKNKKLAKFLQVWMHAANTIHELLACFAYGLALHDDTMECSGNAE